MEDTTVAMLEGQMTSSLDKMSTYEPGTKERSACLTETTELADRLIELRKEDMDYYLKDNQQRIDEKRNDEAAENERKKQTLDWKKISFEMAKLLIPLAINWGLQFKRDQKGYEFEENNCHVSQTAKQSILSRVTWWK